MRLGRVTCQEDCTIIMTICMREHDVCHLFKRGDPGCWTVHCPHRQ